MQAAQVDHDDKRTAARIESKPVGGDLVNRKRLVDSESEQKSLSGELGYRIDEHQRIAWQGDYFRQEADAWMPPQPFPTKDAYLGFPKRNSTRNALHYTFENQEALIHKAEARAYYQKGKRVMKNITNTYAVGPSPSMDMQMMSEDELNTYGAQFSLASYLFGRNTTVFGMEYQMDELDVEKTTRMQMGSAPAIQQPSNKQKAEQSFWSAFLQQQFIINDALEANLGTRYYSINSKLKQSDYRDTTSKSDSQLVGAASLVWQTTDISSLRMNISQGYTYPSITQQFTSSPGNGAENYGNPNLKAEKATTLELGGRIEGKQLTLDATLYQSFAKDFIHKAPISSPPSEFFEQECRRNNCFIWQNASKAKTSGLELLASYQLDTWKPYINLGIQKRELKYAATSAAPKYKTTNSGLPIFKTRAGINWQATDQLSLDFYLRSYGKSKTEVTWVRETGVPLDKPIIEARHSYAEFNLEAYYQVNQNLSLSAAALNLTNRDYQNPNELPSAGRAFNAEINWHF